MTVMATTAKEFNVGQIIAVAYRRAAVVGSGQAPSEAQYLDAIDELGLIMQGLSANGFFAKTIDFYNLVGLQEGVFQYSLPVNLIDVVGPGMYIAPGYSDISQADSELYVTQATREEWHTTQSKAAAQPSIYYAHRSPTQVQIMLWPVPSASEAGGAIRFQVHRLRADVTDRNATVDAERYWTEWLVYQLAAVLSTNNGMPMQRIANLEARAAEKLKVAETMSKQSAPMRITLNHPTGWGRSR